MSINFLANHMYVNLKFKIMYLEHWKNFNQ